MVTIRRILEGKSLHGEENQRNKEKSPEKNKNNTEYAGD
jgi:hypothetical protein